MSYHLISAYGLAHVYDWNTRKWVGATSLEDGMSDCATLITVDNRPIVVVCGGRLYPTHASHRAVDVSTGEVLWCHSGTVAANVVPIAIQGRAYVGCSSIAKYSSERELIDPTTGEVLFRPPSDFPASALGLKSDGRFASDGGPLFAVVDETGARILRGVDGSVLANLARPSGPDPKVSQTQHAGTTFTITETAFDFGPGMQFAFHENGVLVEEKGHLLGFNLSGEKTVETSIPEGTRVVSLAWSPEGWLALLSDNQEHATLCYVSEKLEIIRKMAWDRHASWQLEPGGLLRCGLELFLATTGEQLEPLQVPSASQLSGRIEVEHQAVLGDRIRQANKMLMDKGSINGSIAYVRHDIENVQPVAVPKAVTARTAGPVPVAFDESFSKVLVRLAQHSPSEQVPLTAEYLTALETTLSTPLPDEVVALAASGISHLLGKGCMHPSRREELKRLSAELPTDLVPFAVFSVDLESTELTTTWCFRHTSEGVEYFRAEYVAGTRGSGIREESFSTFTMVGPLPLLSLVSDELGRIVYKKRQSNHFASESPLPEVELKFELHLAIPDSRQVDG
jgi:hypothetical protein